MSFLQRLRRAWRLFRLVMQSHKYNEFHSLSFKGPATFPENSLIVFINCSFNSES